MSLSAVALEPMLLRIHEQALEAARGFKHAEARLVETLIAVERQRVFVKLGFGSLFAYATEALDLSPSVAYNAIAVARKAREVPALQAEIKRGAIGISTARKIVSVLTPDNQAEWLERAKMLPVRQLEKAVARENPRKAAPEKAKYVSERRLSLVLGLDEELMLRLRRAQDQVSRSRGRAASLEETLGELVGFYLKHKDPVEKAKRVIAKKGIVVATRVEALARPSPEQQQAETPAAIESPMSLLKSQFTGTVHTPAPEKPTSLLKSRFTGTVHARVPEKAGPVLKSQFTEHARKRTPIPAPVEHAVRLRDRDRCQFPKGPSICGEKRWLDLHHLKPISEGGEHSAENILTLCKAHHREIHGRGGTRRQRMRF